MDRKISQRVRVLIVDDEAAIGRILGLKLKMSGFEAISSTRGAEALEIIRTGEIDVVLLDIVMPDMDGFEVLDNLRKFSMIPVIVFTARPEVVKLAMRLGANDSVAKPFDPDRLIEKIRSVAAASSPERASGNGAAFEGKETNVRSG